MKKRKLENKSSKKIFAFVILSFLLLEFLAVFIISAAETGSLQSNSLTDWVMSIYENYLRPTEGFAALGIEELENPDIVALITIIGVIVFASIIYEVSYLLPLSTFTDMLIGSGALIILIATKLMRTWITYLMIWIAALFGAGGMLGMFMIGIIFIVLAFATFTGTQFAHKWIDKIRYNQELQRKKKHAYEAASSVEALNTEAENIFSKHGGWLFRR